MRWGRAALAGACRTEGLPRIFDDLLVDVVAGLGRGPRANGCATDLWTLALVADVIEAITDGRYSQTQGGTILHDHLGWSPPAAGPPGPRAQRGCHCQLDGKGPAPHKKRPAPGRLSHPPMAGNCDRSRRSAFQPAL
jgi:hypothetical protein